MIFLENNTINKVVLTLDESSHLSNPYYLFHIKNEFNIEDTGVYYYTPDLSNYRNRYNLFNFDISSTGSTTGGNNISINLIGGQYAYTVYESTGATISLSATTGRIVEEGRLVVALDNNNNNSIYL